MSQNEENDKTEEVKENTPENAPENTEQDVSQDAVETEPVEETTESETESEVDDTPTFEEVVESLAIKELEVERLKEGILAGEKEINDLQSRLRSVSAAYKKEKEDQESFKVRIERQMEYRSSRRRGEVVKVLFEPLENLRRSHASLSKKVARVPRKHGNIPL